MSFCSLVGQHVLVSWHRPVRIADLITGGISIFFHVDYDFCFKHIHVRPTHRRKSLLFNFHVFEPNEMSSNTKISMSYCAIVQIRHARILEKTFRGSVENAVYPSASVVNRFSSNLQSVDFFVLSISKFVYAAKVANFDMSPNGSLALD